MKLKKLQKIYFKNAVILSLVLGILSIFVKMVITGRLVYPYYITFIASFAATYFISLFEDFYANKKLKRYKFWIAFSVRTIVYSSIIKVAYFIDMTFDYDSYKYSVLEKLFQWQDLADYSESIILFGVPVTILVIFAALISIIAQINSMLGKGVLVNYIMGKYHRPKVESRIFMFLDLKSSTTIAETLGHIKYSEFLQDFFAELDDAVVESRGILFQYVGDEVVMVWEVEKGIENCNCIRFFFLVEDRMNELSDRFMKKFGVAPEYKAGLHFGEVSVAQIGSIKKDIAFHGDPMNTTSRICLTCNEAGEKLLISQELLKRLKPNGNYSFHSKGEFQLKGKRKPIELFGIKRNVK